MRAHHTPANGGSEIGRVFVPSFHGNKRPRLTGQQLYTCSLFPSTTAL